MKQIWTAIAVVAWLTPAFGQKRVVFGTDDYVRALKTATDVMVNDATSPVAASRYYAYITLAAVETAALFDPNQPHFAGVLKGFHEVTVADSLIKKANSGFSTILVLYKAGARFLPSGYLLQQPVDSLLRVASKSGLSGATIDASMAVADKSLSAVLQYAAADGFNRLSGFRRFTPSNGDEFWQPTAPGFMSAIEPYWSTLRPFFIDSSSQFTGVPLQKYSTDTGSTFYRQMKEVYDIGNHLSPAQAAMAFFWDCNPFALRQVGHLEFGIKKISPGGHWIGITGIACKKQRLPLAKTAFAHALVSAGIADGFIACWYDKYRDNRVRPETAIRKLLDPGWSPVLQTPPFPEYTSGHSVISTIAAEILTYLFGDHFAFNDITEMEFDLPARKFTSFNSAAREAAISRLYGGIHFRDAVENGVVKGEQIGKLVVSRAPGNPALSNTKLATRNP